MTLLEATIAHFYDFSAKLNNGELKPLADYRGKVLLVVNTASKCGFTPQYKGLEELYQKHHAQGLEILGFPCDQFGHQEPGSDAEIKSFCELNYGVTFPLFAKIEVNGDGADPLYKFLKSQAGGILGEGIKWNFTKFLVGRDGEVLERFASVTTPSALESKVENALKA
jgi:glutathione peroxidase